jgi:hypothetical protein
VSREREPKRLAHRAAEQSRFRATGRWIAEEIDEALDISQIVDTGVAEETEPQAEAALTLQR